MEPLKLFLQDFWAWEVARYYLIGVGVMFLIVAFFLRRVLLGVCLAVVAVYGMLAVFLMSSYERHGFTMEWALAAILGGALVVAFVIYYAVFVRS